MLSRLLRNEGVFMDYALYIASVVGAIALFMMMPRRGVNPRWIGALLGAAVLGGLWLFLHRELSDAMGTSVAGKAYYYIFSGLAIAAAVRVITHTKPVYSALWFVMVVLASSGLLIVLAAEFVALAMVIIYGGAILVTYMFVIMLAAQAGDPDAGQDVPEYETVSREPAIAVAAGFIFLAVLLTVLFEPIAPNPTAAGLTDSQIVAADTGVLANRAVNRLAHRLGDQVVPDLVDRAAAVSNVERLGLDLFRENPLGLELAGVILLVSLVGAIVIARQRVEVPEARGN